jgi:L-fuconolactonase
MRDTQLEGEMPSEAAQGVGVIDTHAHVWKFASPWMDWLQDRPDNWNVVRRDFPWSELRSQLDGSGARDVILVQASPSCAETREYLALAAEEPRILGVVGWVSLASLEATRADLETLEGPNAAKLVGIRNNHGWAPDGEVLATLQVLDSCRLLAERGLTLDLHFRDQRELPIAVAIADAVPELTLIIDHLGKPLLRDRALFADWKRDIAELADRPNVFLKYSGWATFLGGARADDVRELAAHAIDTFGAGRMMFGSNWPVALVADSYAATYRATMEALPALSNDEWRMLLRGTAQRCYFARTDPETLL